MPKITKLYEDVNQNRIKEIIEESQKYNLFKIEYIQAQNKDEKYQYLYDILISYETSDSIHPIFDCYRDKEGQIYVECESRSGDSYGTTELQEYINICHDKGLVPDKIKHIGKEE